MAKLSKEFLGQSPPDVQKIIPQYLQRRGQWGEGLTAAEMQKCRWLKPRLVATIDCLERTAADHLRHPVFVSCTLKNGDPFVLRTTNTRFWRSLRFGSNLRPI